MRAQTFFSLAPCLLLVSALAGAGCSSQEAPGSGAGGYRMSMSAGAAVGTAGTGGWLGTGGRLGVGGSFYQPGGSENLAGHGAGGSSDCSQVGCGPPPVCGQACGSACGCCLCGEGERSGDLVCTSQGCYAPAPADAAGDVASDGGCGADTSCPD